MSSSNTNATKADTPMESADNNGEVGTQANKKEPDHLITSNGNMEDHPDNRIPEGDHGKNNKEDDTSGEEKEKDEQLSAFVLPRCIVKFLENAPYGSAREQEGPIEISPDHEYFNALLAVETCRALRHFLDSQNRIDYFTKIKVENSTLFKRKNLGESMDDLLLQLTTKLGATRKRIEEVNQKPLIEKFLHALGASPEEARIFRFLLCLGMMPYSYFGQSTSSHRIPDPMYAMRDGVTVPSGMAVSDFTTPSAISQIFDIPLPRIMQLMMPDSIWVKEQLYCNNSHSSSPMSVYMASGIGNGPTASVLQGYEVSLTQYNALKSSLLQTTLLDHSPFRDSDAGKKASKIMNHTGSKPLPENIEKTNALADALMIGAKTNGKGGSRTKGKRDRLFDALAISMQAEKKDMKFKKPKNSDGPSRGKENNDLTNNRVVESMENAVLEKKIVAKSTDDEFSPYPSDLTYLEDQVRANMLKKRIVQLKTYLDVGDDDDVLEGVRQNPERYPWDYHRRKHPDGPKDENARFQEEKKLEKFQQRLAQLRSKMDARIRASAVENGKVFRLEQLCEALHLGAFEKSCILLLLQDVIIPDQRHQQDPNYNYNPKMTCSIGNLISSFCSTLEEKMRSRSYFYKTSTMIEEGILTIFNDDFTSDLNSCQVKLDRRLFDFLIGLETEMSELVNGSHLYKPDISVEDVIIPEKTKKRVLDSVLTFDAVKDVIHETGMDEKISYGLGQILLFYGASGTGKTMLANAVASKLGVKILLVNFPDFGVNSSGAVIKFLFREARINKALLFFDECESLFMSREKQRGKGSINMLLAELERFDGICILATNRAFDLDEAMHRRISLSIEFQRPDHIMREKLWKTIMPSGLTVDDDINFGLLGKKYELTGGTIKNAWIQSISLMIQRGADKICQVDLEQAANEQVRNQLTSDDFDLRVIPTSGIDEMVLDETVKESLNNIVQYSKAQSVLFGQWGFDKIHRSTTGISAMFHGVPGTGKTMAAEAIGFDLAKPLLVVNVAELVSKWVGETGKNIAKIFATAKSKEAILVFDEAEGLFGSRKSSEGSTSRHDNLNVGLLLQYIENFTGICIIITNMKENIDEAFFRRFRFVLEFKMPNTKEREQIWKSTLPDQCPVAKDVNFRELAHRYEMSGGGVKNALLRAATAAALRDSGKNVVTMSDLETACEAEEGKMGNKATTMNMYS